MHSPHRGLPLSVYRLLPGPPCHLPSQSAACCLRSRFRRPRRRPHAISRSPSTTSFPRSQDAAAAAVVAQSSCPRRRNIFAHMVMDHHQHIAKDHVHPVGVSHYCSHHRRDEMSFYALEFASRSRYFGRELIAVFLLCFLLTPVKGGKCWSAMVRNGRCSDLLSEKVTKEECCASNSVATAWSTEDMDAGTLFFWRVLNGGVPCYACKESCSGVQCSEGKKCVVRRGGPKCVCSPDCRGKSRHKGPVCGSDGRSYRTVCRLRKRACRRKTSTLAVAYHGQCQSSCDRIRCPAGKDCLRDQNLSLHCVRCSQRCPTTPASAAVCGTDAVTYQSACHLREAACRKGEAIPVAYKGRCKSVASCDSIRCKERQSCLTELPTGTPRCVTCSYRCPKPRSPSGARRDMGGPICGSNNRTYHSWCHMLKDACATGYVIKTKFSGSCENGGAKRPVANTVLDDNLPEASDRFS